MKKLVGALRRLGRSRQRRALAGFGLMYVLVGWIYLGTDIAAPTSRQAYKVHLEIMPLGAWSWLFIGCGLVAMLTAGLGRFSWVGFGALQVITAGWGSGFFATWAATGYTRIGAQGCIWALLALVITDYAGADDPLEGR